MDFTYNKAKDSLKNHSYLWEGNLEQVERIISEPLNEIIAFPTRTYKDDRDENRVVFFSSRAIYDLRFEDGSAYTLSILKTKDIEKINLDIQGKQRATITIHFHNEIINVASADCIYMNQRAKNVYTIIEIAKMYTSGVWSS